MDDVGDIFEVLNLDDFLSIEEIDFNLPPLLEGDEEVDSGEDVGGVQEEYLNPSLFLHTTYYSFERGLGNYFVDWCNGRIVPLADTINTFDPNFFCRDGVSLEVWHKGILKKWERYGRQFEIRTGTNGEACLFNKKNPHLFILYVEEWPSIVLKAYHGGERHRTYKETVAKIEEEGWIVGTQLNGIPNPFIEKVISSCSVCHYGHQAHERTVHRLRQYNAKYTMPLGEVEAFLNNLKAQHLVRLKPIHRYPRVKPLASNVIIYVCH